MAVTICCGHSCHNISLIQADTGASLGWYELFRKTNGFSLAGGNEQVTIAWSTAGSGESAKLACIEHHRARFHVHAEDMMAQVTHHAMGAGEGYRSARFIGQDRHQAFIGFQVHAGDHRSSPPAHRRLEDLADGQAA